MSTSRCMTATLACALVALASMPADASRAKPRLLVKQGISHARDMGERVRQRLEAHGFVVGTPPAWVVAPSVTKLQVDKTTVTCAVEIRVAPLDARGREVWESTRTMVATGTAQLTSGRPLKPREVPKWSADCVDTAIAETVARRVVPFFAR